MSPDADRPNPGAPGDSPATPVPDATSSAAAIASVPVVPASSDRLQPVSVEAQIEVRMTPAEAVARMRIRIPERGNRKLRDLIERVNDDKQLKAMLKGLRTIATDHQHLQLVQIREIEAATELVLAAAHVKSSGHPPA